MCKNNAEIPSTYGDLPLCDRGTFKLTPETCREVAARLTPEDVHFEAMLYDRESFADWGKNAQLLDELCERLRICPNDYYYGNFRDASALLTALRRKCECPIAPVTRAWKVYGQPEHQQKISFESSDDYDWTTPEYGVRLVSIDTAERTGTHDYVIVRITRNTAQECGRELDGQLSDGIFENYHFGKVEEIFD